MYFPTWESFLNTVDKTSTAWRQLIGQATSSDTSGIVAGTILDFGGLVAPTGYLACDGSAVSQTTYAALFTAIGTTWNTGGEGAGNFRLPNLNRRTTVGSGGSGTGTLGNAVGNTGGAETHTLALSESPAHDHGAVTGGEAAHTHSGTTGGESGHVHQQTVVGASTGTNNANEIASTRPVNNGSGGGSGNPIFTDAAASDGTNGVTALNTQGSSGHTHGFTTGAGSNHTHSVSSSGGGGAHNNMQPSAVVLKIIKT